MRKFLEYTFLYYRYDYKTGDITKEYCCVFVDGSRPASKNCAIASRIAANESFNNEDDLEFVSVKAVNSDDLNLPF